jgi:hypothetical protein
VRLDGHRLGGEAVDPHQLRERARAVDPGAEPLRDRRHVERVIEVGVADQHRVGAIDPRRDRCRRWRHHPAHHEVAQ